MQTADHMEIERKWLVKGWPDEDLPLIREETMRQGYVTVEPTVRIREERAAGEEPKFLMTLKSSGQLSRREIEFPVGRDIFCQIEALIGRMTGLELKRVLAKFERLPKDHDLPLENNAQVLMEYEGGISGMALNLEHDFVGAVLLGSDHDIKEGASVKRTKRIVSVPVGEELLGDFNERYSKAQSQKAPEEVQKWDGAMPRFMTGSSDNLILDIAGAMNDADAE